MARSLHTTAVVTPEAVLLEFRAAGVGSRLLAKAVDTFIQLVLIYIVGIGILIVAGSNEAAGVILIVISLFLVFFVYPMTEAFFGGATPGKRALDLRVITLEGGPIGLRHAAIRAMIWLPELLLPPGGLLPLGSALLTRRSQRLGDLAAGTVVIRTSTAEADPTFFAPAFGAEQFSQQFDASRLSPKQFALMREFLLRAHELRIESRRTVARTIAAGVEAATGVPRPIEVDPERYIVACTFAYQHRYGPTAPLAS